MAIEAGTIHVWHGKLDIDNAERFLSIIDSAERAKALAASIPQRLRHVAVRGQVRETLSHYLPETPAAIRFDRLPHGKPYLPDHPDIAFNLSHSGDYLVIAIGKHCNLGIDLEICQARKHLPALVAKCFAEAEAKMWHSLSEDQQIAAFYRIWTKKEALVKATGRGIALGLQHCITHSQQPERFFSVPKDCEPASQWQVRELALTSDACCAIVSDKPINEVCVFNLSDTVSLT